MTGFPSQNKSPRPFLPPKSYDEFFARDWNKVIMVPYVPHALLTSRWGRSSMYNLASSAQTTQRLRMKRRITFYFRGGVLHGVDCKKNGTWVRKAAYETFRQIRGAKFEPTENMKLITNNNGIIADWVNEKTRHSKLMKTAIHNFEVERYAEELQQSQYCLHFRGDTTTSRRVYDAIAAGCVPVLISDGTNMPFRSSLDWNSFAVQIPESTLLRGPAHARPIFEALLSDSTALRDRQHALAIARHDLIYGIGSPVNASRSFASRVADHILEESFEFTEVQGRFRQFPDAFGSCQSKPAEPSSAAAGTTDGNGNGGSGFAGGATGGGSKSTGTSSAFPNSFAARVRKALRSDW